MGRPTKRTPAVEKKIVNGLSKGIPLTVLCLSSKDMPSDVSVRNWMKADPKFSSAIAGAREAGYDVIANRARETARGKGDSTDNVKRDKLIVETDLKLLAKWDPKRYGDKIDVTSGGEKVGTEANEVTRFSRLAAMVEERRESGQLSDLDE